MIAASIKALARRARGVGAVCGGVSLWLAPALAAAQSSPPSASAQVARLALGLVVVVAVLLLSARLLPRLGGVGLAGSESFRVVASLPVGQRERVVVLQVGERQVLLGVAAGRVNLLHALEQPLHIDGASPAMQGWLGRALGKRGQSPFPGEARR